jgi:aminoglycoside/choline kinase family phosphotransferase
VPRAHVQGDASTRVYERLAHQGRNYILMNAKRRPDGPAVRGGLPYSAIAHLAEDVKPFVAMARALRERGLSAPQVQAADLNEGFLLLEDLGSEAVVAGEPPSRSKSATPPRSICWSSCTASPSPRRFRSRPVSTTACPLTISTPS